MNELEALSQIKEDLRKEIIEEVLDIVRDEIEENFSVEFIQEVEDAELRASRGDVTSYTPEKLKETFL